MKFSFLAALSVALIVSCNSANAQSYEFRQGYIFDQPYVERVSLEKAEKVANAKGIFEPLMSFDWTKEKELIKDHRIKRTGNRLVLAFSANAELSLKNFSTKRGDGESQTFKYIKSVPGYHIIGVEYGHDQPQFLLVPEQGGHVYFVNTN